MFTGAPGPTTYKVGDRPVISRGTRVPLATDPRSSVNVTALVGSGISSGAVPSISTIATYPDSFIALIPDPLLD